MKRRQMHQTSMEVTVGAFMFMILLTLGFFTIVLSRENVLSKNYRFDVVFNDVSGLIKGDKVFVHGVDVGRSDKTGKAPSLDRGAALSDCIDLHNIRTAR